MSAETGAFDAEFTDSEQLRVPAAAPERLGGQFGHARGPRDRVRVTITTETRRPLRSSYGVLRGQQPHAAKVDLGAVRREMAEQIERAE